MICNKDCEHCIYEDCISDEYDKEIAKRYYDAHKEEINARAREFYAKHIEQRKAYMKAYRAAHPIGYNRAQYLKNRDKIIKRNKAYYQAHKAEKAAYQKQYRAKKLAEGAHK